MKFEPSVALAVPWPAYGMHTAGTHCSHGQAAEAAAQRRFAAQLGIADKGIAEL